jgi:hypothetical protein
MHVCIYMLPKLLPIVYADCTAAAAPLSVRSASYFLLASNHSLLLLLARTLLAGWHAHIMPHVHAHTYHDLISSNQWLSRRQPLDIRWMHACMAGSIYLS